MATDIRTFGAIPDGTTDCTAAINSAIAAGDITIKNGTFLLSASIKIPSNRTIYIENAKLKLAANSFDNIFRNSDFVNGNSNIKIIGNGNAVLDGNSANNSDNYATYGKGAAVNSYRYNLIALCGVAGFELSGLQIVDHPHWTILIQRCSKYANGDRSLVHDLYLNHNTTIVNQDGIDLCQGTNGVDIYNIDGHTGDDFFAINVLNAPDLAVNIPGFSVGDVFDINCWNFKPFNSALGSLLAVVPAYDNTNKIYNITSNNHAPKYSVGSLFSAYGYLGAAATGRLYDITMDGSVFNCICPNAQVINVKDNCENIAVTNFTNGTTKALFHSDVGLTITNFTVNGVAKP